MTLPATGSVAWKRRVLRQQADILEGSQRFHEAQAVLNPLMASVQLECAEECAYLATVLRVLAAALWPAERGLDLALIMDAIRTEDHPL